MNLDVLRNMIAEDVANAEIQSMPRRPPASLPSTKVTNEPCTSDDSGHEQIIAMCNRVSLLDLVREDTGETGRATGERVDFHKCPICGHADDFSVYPATNSFSCFSDSMAGKRAPGADSFGGNVLDYLQWARFGGDNTAAITKLHELSGIPYEPKPKEVEAANNASKRFPLITQCLVLDPPKRAPVLIDGLLRQGHTLLVTSRSKAGKTWLMLELAVSVACGMRWLGWQCKQGRVLFVNPEVDPPSAENRLHDVAQAMGADLLDVQANIQFWHLRGHVQGMEDTKRELLKQADANGLTFSLIILDSIYELYDGDENSAQDARAFFHHISEVAKSLNCSIAMTHHHAKGARSELDALDRGSGSGVFGRATDAPIDLIQVFPPDDEEPGNIEDGATYWRVSDSGLREFPSFSPFEVCFKYPIHEVITDGSAVGWKPKSGQQTGGKATGAANKKKSASRAQRCEMVLMQAFLFGVSDDSGINASEAAAIVSDALGETVKAQTLKTYIEASEFLDVEQINRQRWRVVLANPKPKESVQDSILNETA